MHMCCSFVSLPKLCSLLSHGSSSPCRELARWHLALQQQARIRSSRRVRCLPAAGAETKQKSWACASVPRLGSDPAELPSRTNSRISQPHPFLAIKYKHPDFLLRSANPGEIHGGLSPSVLGSSGSRIFLCAPARPFGGVRCVPAGHLGFVVEIGA